MIKQKAMNEHLVHHPGHPHIMNSGVAGDLDPEHAETTEVLLSLLQQNKALSGKYLIIDILFIL